MRFLREDGVSISSSVTGDSDPPSRRGSPDGPNSRNGPGSGSRHASDPPNGSGSPYGSALSAGSGEPNDGGGVSVATGFMGDERMRAAGGSAATR